MCPIETPEGPNIGLISYLASFARINAYGFIEAPYRRVDKETGVVTDDVVYMTADIEDNYTIAQANEPLTEDHKFARKKVNARFRDQILECERERVDFMDVSPKMVVSIATAMIPFLENDDANRALMGANMQRQAVPLLKTEAPIVGTGMEYKAAVDSGVCVISRHDGIVDRVTADEVVIKEGTGAIPADTSLVKVHYEGRLLNDSVFDSSYKRGQPINLRCNQTIKGWTDAMVHMPAGSIWEVYIPQELAYGEREQGMIKPFSMLKFKIELIEVNPKK
jgi:DNA-directed RNA polymerase beta subunit